MSKVFKACICILMCMCLTGCSRFEEPITETTLQVSKGGAVVETIVEMFDKDYYNVDELKGEISDAIMQYPGAADSIKFDDIHTEDNNVYVTLEFASLKDYEQFQKKEAFYGSINDAYDAGYSMDVTLKGIKEGDKISKAELMQMSDEKIIIVSEPVCLRTPYKIAYVSANVEVIDSKCARISNESTGLAYVVLK